ncbi:MAG: hypothetical protein ACFB0E_10395 [Leptolyngbyaceae cyanobacterium]
MYGFNKADLTTYFWRNQAIKIGCLILLSISVSTACSTSPESDEASNSETEELAVGEDGLAGLENQSVTLYGNFKEKLGGSLFLIAEDRQEELGDILVLNQSSAFTVPDDADTPLWAVGEVKPLNLAELETVDQEELASYDGELVLHADRIALAPTPEDLSANSDVFYNESVTVVGEVEQVEADNTFILREPGLFSGDGVVVIQTGDSALTPVIEDDRVAVSGVLRPYIIAELEEDYDLTWDLTVQESLEAEFQSTPVLVIDYVSEPIESD